MGAGIRYFYRCDLSDQERKSTGSRLYAVGDHRAFRTGILAWSDGNPDFFGTVRMASVRRTGFLDRIHFTIVYNGMWNHGGSGEILPFFHVRDIERRLCQNSKSKGQKEILVMFLHAFRNSLIQVITDFRSSDWWITVRICSDRDSIFYPGNGTSSGGFHCIP